MSAKEGSSRLAIHRCLVWWEACKTLMNNSEFHAHTEKLERLLQQVNDLRDEEAQSVALQLMQAIMDLHGAALSRITEVLASSGETARHALAIVADDPLVCGLLVLYGIHPLTLEDRVLGAMEKIKPKLQKLGTSLELTGIDDSTVRLRVLGSRTDHSAPKMQETIEQAVREAAPEVAEVAIEGLPVSGFVALTDIQPAVKYETGEGI